MYPYPRQPYFEFRQFLLRWIVIALTLAGLMVLWYLLPSIEAALAPDKAEPRAVSARGDLAADEKATIEIFQKTKDSVVFITTSSLVRDFWTRNVYSVPRGTGSGFVWDEAGHIVTNFHVVRDAAEATVKLADGRSYRAILVGANRNNDIAVLKIGVGFKRPPPVPIGTSNDLKVGQKVFAIGNPFGLDWTLTSGIVSALDRSLSGDASEPTVEHLIQTDAAINPGNSGGPLLDSAGRLIGINTAIYSPSGTSAGIGFAVPVDTVMRVVPQLISKGRYIRPSLGIGVDESLNERITEWLGVKGVVVLRVSPSSAAAKAGLVGAKLSSDGTVVPGDIIVAVNGQEVDSVGKLLSRLDGKVVGDQIQLTVLRDRRQVTLSIELEAGT